MFSFSHHPRLFEKQTSQIRTITEENNYKQRDYDQDVNLTRMFMCAENTLTDHFIAFKERFPIPNKIHNNLIHSF